MPIKKHIPLGFNDPNTFHSFLLAIKKNNIDITRLLMNFAEKNHIVLPLNERNSQGEFSLLSAINNGNVNMVKNLMDYAERQNVIFDIQETDLQHMTINRTLFKLLENYSEKYNLQLKVKEHANLRMSVDGKSERELNTRSNHY